MAGVGGATWEAPPSYLAFDQGALGYQFKGLDPFAPQAEAPIVVRKREAVALDLPVHRTRWRYLDDLHRAAIRRACQDKTRDWRRVVLHASRSATGNKDLVHHQVLGQRPHLGVGPYHFIIGNGSFSGDGEIETTRRWIAQQEGGSMGVPEIDEASISVCLIGRFQTTGPTPAQWQALDELMAYLRAQLGALTLSAHHEVESTAPSCPGPAITLENLRQLDQRTW